MNWDWDKLQEQRKRQPKPTARPERDQDDNHGSGGGDNNGGGFNNGGSRGNGPDFGQMGDTFKQFKNSRFPIIKIGLVIALLAWLGTGIFIVGPDEVGIILRFGAYQKDRVLGPGPHYRLPYPIEEALTPKVKNVHRVEIGFRTLRNSRDGQAAVRLVPEEAAMLTGDEAIIYVQFIVQYQIKDPAAFLFNVDLQIARGYAGQDMYSETVKNAAEAAMRDVIGSSKIDDALTEDKLRIQLEAQDILQNILDGYGAGISIQTVQMQDVHAPQEVSDAFKDVASAREDKTKFVNEATKESNKIIPEAEGEAQQILNKARAYQETTIAQATGEAQRFEAILKEYSKAPAVTKKRMYLEAMEEILASPGVEKIIIGDDASGKVLPYLPLDRLNGQRRQ